MRHSQLKAFHSVAIHGGFSRAAEALNQTQPALSDQVRRLEQEHDVLLFHRSHKGIRLTEKGEALLLHTKRYFEVEQQIEGFLSQSRSAVSGSLRIMADSAIHVTETLARYRRMHPGVFIRIHTGNSADVLEALRNYDAEIGVLGSLEPAADLETVDLGSSPIIAIAARDAAVAKMKSIGFADLANHPLVFREKGSRTRQGLEREARRRGRELVPVIEVEGREAMREVVASGAGIGFISRAESGLDPRLVQIPIRDADLQMTETLVYLANRRDVPVIRSFVHALQG